MKLNYTQLSNAAQYSLRQPLDELTDMFSLLTVTTKFFALPTGSLQFTDSPELLEVETIEQLTRMYKNWDIYLVDLTTDLV